MKFILLILSLPTENATVRMRAWRGLKASGAAVLRDGVYLMPALEHCRVLLDAIAADVLAGGGTAYVLDTEAPQHISFIDLFDRATEYAALLADVLKERKCLTVDNAQAALKSIRQLRKRFAQITEIDFFPNEAQKQVDTALQELEVAAARFISPDEPHSVEKNIPKLLIDEYQSRVWATRSRPWVDRLACAWLIQRFIDPQAQFVWLKSISDCPSDVLGFDFDGATFSHVGHYVSFEVMLMSFGLEQSSLKRLAALIHYLDVGGIQPPESAGIESVLMGLRDTILDDDLLMRTVSSIFDGLLVTFEKGVSTQ